MTLTKWIAIFKMQVNMITIREPKYQDKADFLRAVARSQSLHQPWVSTPVTSEDFKKYIQRSQEKNEKYFLVFKGGNIAGVFNISGIARGYFKSAYLGFYVFSGYENQGIMTAGLKLVLRQVFDELKLHRIEANIQPENTRSINFVKRNKFRYEGFSPRYLKIEEIWRGHEHWAITYEDYIRDNPDILEKDCIELVPYNPKWPELAGIEINKIRSTFPSEFISDIQHVGSTAIPGLSAKPIIDIQIAVNSLEIAKLIAVPLLQKMGYEFWDENPDETRLFFVKGMPPYGERRTHHVHIVLPDSHHWKNKLIFRDYLRAHPEAAQQYETIKKTLAQNHQYDREKYTDAKMDFINDILSRQKDNSVNH